MLEHHVSPTAARPHGRPARATRASTRTATPSRPPTAPSRTFSGRRFATLEPGDHGRLVRVDDTEPAMLTWLREQSIALDVRLELVARRPFGGPFLVRVSDGTASGTGREHRPRARARRLAVGRRCRRRGVPPDVGDVEFGRPNFQSPTRRSRRRTPGGGGDDARRDAARPARCGDRPGHPRRRAPPPHGPRPAARQSSISAELRSPLGDPTAYEVRGTLVVLRGHQARTVHVELEDR